MVDWLHDYVFLQQPPSFPPPTQMSGLWPLKHLWKSSEKQYPRVVFFTCRWDVKRTSNADEVCTSGLEERGIMFCDLATIEETQKT